MNKIEHAQLPLHPMNRIKYIHFVGIGGAGMSGIAEVLHNQGYQVSGSDLKISKVTKRLESLGIRVTMNHHAKNVQGIDVVVLSTAIAADNPEILAAREARIPIVPRAEMLAELMRFRYGIAVAGSHGKTTVTCLIASLLAKQNFDPTFVIGGQLNSVGSHAQLGESPFFLAEADESDASFLYLKPMLAVITNIDLDHMQTYDNDLEVLLETFTQFIHNLPFYGVAVVCLDDPNVKNILAQLSRPVVTYGFDEQANIRILSTRVEGLGSHIRLQIKGRAQPLDVTVNLVGRYNIQNTVAAIAVALECGVSLETIQYGLADFAGVSRRFEVYEQSPIAGRSVTLIDDYGHHPNELTAVIATVRDLWPQQRLVMVFQPHRYTRTRDLFNDFLRVLSQVDVLLLLDVYAASEAPIPGADSRALYNALRAHALSHCHWVGALSALEQHLAAVLQDNDILVMQGAGDVGSLVVQLRQEIVHE